jgi:hypothetical protein
MHDLALVREHCTSGILLSPDACATVGRVVDLLQPDRLKQAFSVEGAGLQRYLATQSPADVTADSSTGAAAESPVNPRRKIDMPRKAEGPRRKDEDILSKRSRHNPSHSRSGRNWDTD